jgi:hypothetical protein
MKNHGKVICLFTVVALAAAFSSCARQPTQKRSAALIKSYFQKYGKKYPESEFGGKKISEVEVISQNEVHKHLVAVEAFITPVEGDVKRVFVTIDKGPVGWRFVSWENASQMSQ